jgi:hypothetical protein
MPDENSAARIRELNDQFRKSLMGGRILMTPGVSTLSSEQTVELLTAVKTFDSFTEDNDPYGEHDFGSIEMHDTKYFWKIDYYDPSMTYGSEDAADASKTVRVLTIMRADEY